jgi:hypothetical protein
VVWARVKLCGALRSTKTMSGWECTEDRPTLLDEEGGERGPDQKVLAEIELIPNTHGSIEGHDQENVHPYDRVIPVSHPVAGPLAALSGQYSSSEK